MGWGGGGLLTRKMEEGKRKKVVIIFDILVIITFIWFALTQRASYDSGYQSCFAQVCSNRIGGLYSDAQANTICYNIAKAQAQTRNMSAEEWLKTQSPRLTNHMVKIRHGEEGMLLSESEGRTHYTGWNNAT